MKIISPSFQIETPIHGEHADNILRAIERAARTCYKSECKIGTMDDTRAFVRKIVHVKKHESVIEHQSVTVRFIVDRGILAEISRHRLCALSVESTRFCAYNNDRFGNEITVIKPCFWDENSAEYQTWEHACHQAEISYNYLTGFLKRSPQEARSVLPNSLKTEIVMTCNLREWRHVFNLRCSLAAHPQMREVMIPLRGEFVKHLPEIFGDAE